MVDFIGYGNLFVGNVADIAIFAGAIMLAILTVMGVHLRRPAAVPADPADSTGAAGPADPAAPVDPDAPDRASGTNP